MLVYWMPVLKPRIYIINLFIIISDTCAPGITIIVIVVMDHEAAYTREKTMSEIWR